MISKSNEIMSESTKPNPISFYKLKRGRISYLKKLKENALP